MADARRAATQFLEAIPQVMMHLRQQLAASSSGLTFAQFRCLKMVQRCAATSLGDLADANGVSAPAMSKLVDGLVEGRLLARRTDGHDRRRIELTITPAGRRKVDAVTDDLKAQLAGRLADLPAADLAALERALDRLSQAMQASPKVAA